MDLSPEYHSFHLNSEFFQKTSKTVLLITQPPNILEAILYSKRMAGYPLATHIKAIVAFLQAD